MILDMIDKCAFKPKPAFSLLILLRYVKVITAFRFLLSQYNESSKTTFSLPILLFSVNFFMAMSACK